MLKIALMTDSSADISNEDAAKYGIYVLRFPLTINGIEYIEEESITLNEFTQKMYDGAIAKTAQSIIGRLLTMWDELLLTYDHVIYSPISSGLSGAYQTAMVQSKAYDGKVTVINSKCACYPHQLLCREIKKMVDRGYQPNEIKEIIEKESLMWAVLIPEDLVYLKRGGRISAAAAALGSLLKIVPLLKVENGAIDALEKVRTLKKAYAVGIELATNVENHEDYYWIVCESNATEKAVEIAKEMEHITNQSVTIAPIFPVIMAHTGPGTIGIGYIKKLIKD